MGCPGLAVVRFDMGQHTNSRRSNGGPIKVKVSVNLSPGREFWIDSGSPHQIEREKTLGEEPVPQVHGELGVNTAKASNQMVLESSDGAFSGIAPVDTRRDQLVININVSHVSLEYIRALVVQSLETRAETGLDKIADTPLVGLENGRGMSGRDWFGINDVAVVVVEDKEVVVAETGRGGETSGLIGVDQARGIGFDHSCKAMIRWGSHCWGK